MLVTAGINNFTICSKIALCEELQVILLVRSFYYLVLLSIVICLPLEPLNLNIPCRVFVTAQRLENLPSCSVKFDLVLHDVQ